MELAHVGHDLPGAVQVVREEEPPEFFDPAEIAATNTTSNDDNVWRFSLAGVGLSFSMLRRDERLTLPAHGQGGDWIVKLPGPRV